MESNSFFAQLDWPDPMTFQNPTILFLEIIFVYSPGK